MPSCPYFSCLFHLVVTTATWLLPFELIILSTNYHTKVCTNAAPIYQIMANLLSNCGRFDCENLYFYLLLISCELRYLQQNTVLREGKNLQVLMWNKQITYFRRERWNKNWSTGATPTCQKLSETMRLINMAGKVSQHSTREWVAANMADTRSLRKKAGDSQFLSLPIYTYSVLHGHFNYNYAHIKYRGKYKLNKTVGEHNPPPTPKLSTWKYDMHTCQHKH
jgi:hypothetical protein